MLYEEIQALPERTLILDREDGTWMGAILCLLKPAPLQVYEHGVGPDDALPPYKTGVRTAVLSATRRSRTRSCKTAVRAGTL